MDSIKSERASRPSPVPSAGSPRDLSEASLENPSKSSSQSRDTNAKRRCISTACLQCRKRKSRCNGAQPACSACASVYHTECVYSPHTDHRRKGVYKQDVDILKTRNSALHILIQAILNRDEDEVPELVQQIRTCENLEDLAESIEAGKNGPNDAVDPPDSLVYGDSSLPGEAPRFESELSGRMGDLFLEGSVKFIGGTSNLIRLPDDGAIGDDRLENHRVIRSEEEALLSWTQVTQDPGLIRHLIQMYFCWHYSYFTTLSKILFLRDFVHGRRSQHCSELLVNVMLALGCHFTTRPGTRGNPDVSATAGDNFFQEAKRFLLFDDEFANAKLCTVQALALMSVREAGCGREGKGWVYSGMSFRMALDLGLNVDAPGLSSDTTLTDDEIDARRITFWGCFLFDKCWSNYLGRQPQLPTSILTVPKPEVFPDEEVDTWAPYTDAVGVSIQRQPARTRAVALYISKLAEISSDLLISFYHPNQLEKAVGKQAELKRLSDLHTRLEAWKKELPQEMEPKDGQLPQVLLMHMFFQLLFIHLYRPFLKYTRSTSPLPSHVSPRKFCTQAAGAISKLLRLYKRTYGLRQICNISVYIAHSACTIHLLNLPEKNARRDIIHGVKHLEEIGEMWTCARRTLRILSVMAEKWNLELPEEAETTFLRARSRWGNTDSHPSPTLSDSPSSTSPHIGARTGHAAPSLPHLDPIQHPTHSPAYLPPHSYYGPPIPSPVQTLPTPHLTQPHHPQHPPPLPSLPSPAQRVRQAPHLTTAQRDAWNTHQARLHSSASALSPLNTMGHRGSGTQPPLPRPADANILFGGVDKLVDENQNWWLRDQGALVLGFSNWGDEAAATSGEALPSMSAGVGGRVARGNGIGNGVDGYLPHHNHASRSPQLHSGPSPPMHALSQTPQDWTLLGYADAEGYEAGYAVDGYSGQGQVGKYGR